MTTTWGPSLRQAAGLILLVLGVLIWLVAAPTSVGGSTDYVITHGSSMEPGFTAGDLVAVRSSDDYRVGDVVAYRSDLLGTVVMHRIVDRTPQGFVLQGDNNDFLDPERPGPDQVIGELAVRIPDGGTWLRRITSAPVLAGITFLLVAGGSATSTRRRRRRRQSMSRHARPTLGPAVLQAVPPGVRRGAAVTAGVALLSLVVAVLAWTTPTIEQTSTTQPTGRSMTFGYSAAVAPGPAYDGQVVRSPDPVFRKLADQVEVSYDYRGAPATVALEAVLSTDSGWRTTLPLSPRSEAAVSQGTVRLDLAAIDRRARQAAAATGLPGDRVSVRVVADVRQLSTGVSFRPELVLDLSPLRLVLAGGPAALSVVDPALATVVGDGQRMLGVSGRGLPVTTVRTLSAFALLASVVGAAVVLLLVRRAEPPTEAAGISRRYASLLLEVQPMTSGAGRPVVDVTAFSALARLAERYGLLVLHWSRSGVETFMVQDENTTFRYRTAAVIEPVGVVTGAPSHGRVIGAQEPVDRALPTRRGPTTTVLPSSRP